MKVGVAADHGRLEIIEKLSRLLAKEGHEVIDFGGDVYEPGDDYPDSAIPLAPAVAIGGVERGVLVCGSGVGASAAANKVPEVRAVLCHDDYSRMTT